MSIQNAINRADFNALRLALYQLTGDPALADMEIVHQPVWGGVFSAAALNPEDQEEVKRRTLAYLERPLENVPPPPSDEREVERLMEMFTGRKMSENELRFGAEELAFKEFPRGLQWRVEPSAEHLAKYHATIVGCGVSGIAVAVLLNQLGIRYTIFEREADIGGTWLVNSYPDCRVDIPTYVYQYKFVKNYPWPEYYTLRDDNLKYLKHVANEFGVTPHVLVSSKVLGATWDGDSATWRIDVEGPDGQTRQQVSNFIFNATGQFSTPKLPDIDGIDTFRGKIFHTTAWDHTYQYAGKKIALIGNGATGTQLMPGVAKVAEQLTVYQRTPQWLIPFEGYLQKRDSDDQALCDNIPYYWNWFVFSTFVRTYQLQNLTVFDREWQAKGGLVSEANDKLRNMLIEHIRAKVNGDESELKKLLPDFPPLARRALVDNGWYDALRQENVELVTEGIDRFTPSGILSCDGVERSFDLVILASGFQVSEYMWPIDYVGREGKTRSDVWGRDGSRAYMSIAMPWFPNFFMFYGPNAQPRAGGIHSWAESWARYAVQLAMHVIETNARSIEVRQEAFDAYNAELDEEAKINLRGPSSKGSYYVNSFGRATVNVPWRAEDWHAMLVEPDLSHFATT